jgi:hypothetical protein
MREIEVSGGGASGTSSDLAGEVDLSGSVVEKVFGLIDRLPVAVWAIGIVAGSLAFMAVAAGLMAVVMLAVLA